MILRKHHPFKDIKTKFFYKPMSKITVVVATYNYAHYLPKCLDSILSQTRKVAEILVIDDYSSDNTLKVIKKYKGKIKYIRHKKNLGNIRTYNHGILEAKGNYILILSADDWLNPTIIEKEATILDKHHQVGLVYSQSITVENGKEKLIMPKPAGHTSYIGRKKDFSLFLTEGNFVPGNTPLVRKSVYQKVGLWDTNLPCTGDFEMWMRISKYFPLAYIAKPLAYYRIHTRSEHLKKDYFKKQESEYRYIFNQYILEDKSLRKLIRNLAHYKYFMGISNQAVLSKDFRKAIKFWSKAVLSLPSSLYYWSTWQPLYFFMKHNIFSFQSK